MSKRTLKIGFYLLGVFLIEVYFFLVFFNSKNFSHQSILLSNKPISVCFYAFTEFSFWERWHFFFKDSASKPISSKTTSENEGKIPNKINLGSKKSWTDENQKNEKRFVITRFVKNKKIRWISLFSKDKTSQKIHEQISFASAGGSALSKTKIVWSVLYTYPLKERLLLKHLLGDTLLKQQQQSIKRLKTILASSLPNPPLVPKKQEDTKATEKNLKTKNSSKKKR